MASFVEDSDSEDDENILTDMEVADNVQLGFLIPMKDQESEYVDLFHEQDWSSWDGGKVGGRPAWLDPSNIPSPDELKCAHCSSQMIHLMHLYCPLDEVDDAFHRALYLFCCRSRVCVAKGSVKCIRSQLPRKNNFFPFESEDGDAIDDSYPIGDEKHPYHSKLGHLCTACGIPAPQKCGQCGKEHYCSRSHQLWHWRAGHKHTCTSSSGEGAPAGKNDDGAKGDSEAAVERAPASVSSILFPQYEIAVEEEVLDLSKAEPASAGVNTTVTEPVAENAAADDAQGRAEDEQVTREFESAARRAEMAQPARTASDKVYTRFQRRLRMGGADQVLRYSRWTGAPPLLVHSGAYPLPQPQPQADTSSGVTELSSNIPVPKDCACGSPRQLEFQVMPQLLFFLEVGGGAIVDNTAAHKAWRAATALDWGTLDVWTCTASCGGASYTEEVVTRQQPVDYASGVGGGVHHIE